MVNAQLIIMTDKEIKQTLSDWSEKNDLNLTDFQIESITAYIRQGLKSIVLTEIKATKEQEADLIKSLSNHLSQGLGRCILEEDSEIGKLMIERTDVKK